MKNALEDLRDSIPPFAPWHIETLENIYARYLEILGNIGRRIEYTSVCRPLLDNTELIHWLISDAASTGSPVSYDRAAMELTWDIDALIHTLSR